MVKIYVIPRVIYDTKANDKVASYVMKLCVYFWCITPMA